MTNATINDIIATARVGFLESQPRSDGWSDLSACSVWRSGTSSMGFLLRESISGILAPRPGGTVTPCGHHPRKKLLGKTADLDLQSGSASPGAQSPQGGGDDVDLPPYRHGRPSARDCGSTGKCRPWIGD